MKYFYSYLLRRIGTGAQVGYGHGIAECPPVRDMDGLCKIEMELLNGEGNIVEKVGLKEEEVEVQFTAFTPLP